MGFPTHSSLDIQSIHLGADLYFVGDSAQQIYSFRGGQSCNFMNIMDAFDIKMTDSHRFGDAIASCANVVLFSKEHSPQTTQPKIKNGVPRRIWLPYRVKGLKQERSYVFANDSSSSLLSLIVYHYSIVPTVIAQKNLTLMNIALKLLTESPELKIHINSGSESGITRIKKFFELVDEV